jgi:hypothetical protein
MAKPCPRCSLLSADDAAQCGCGYNFPPGELKAAPLQPRRTRPHYRAGLWLGGVVMAVGVYEVFTESPAAGLVSLIFGASVIAFFRSRLRRGRMPQK